MNINPIAATIRVLQRVASHPCVYDWSQKLTGQEQNLRRIAAQTAMMRAETVIDIGGGTGAWRKLWPNDCRYICLDLEMPKLHGFRSKNPHGLAILCDATRMAVASSSSDVVMCMAMLHHLTDTMLEQVLDEALRVLKGDGRILLIDPVMNRERLAGRALWALDRGAYPRTAEQLQEKLESRFRVVHWEKFAIYHEYVFAVGARL